MSAATIRNRSSYPITLPAPYNVLIAPGDGVVVPQDAATVVTTLGSSAISLLDIEDAPSGQATLQMAGGIGGHAPVRAATVGNITLSGTQTVDGVALAAGDRVLVKNQSTASQNGIYVCQAGGWTRADDATSGANLSSGSFVTVSEGTVNADSAWNLTTNAPITIGTTSLTFARDFSTALSSARIFQLLAPAAASTTAVHAAYAGNSAGTAWTGTITNPAVPRNLTVTFQASWDGGTVTVTGTDQFDASVSEDFAFTNGTRTGSKMFKTVTSIVKASVGSSSNTASVGTGTKLAATAVLVSAFGVLLVDDVAEAVTVDTTYSSFTPTTAPNASHNYKFIGNM